MSVRQNLTITIERNVHARGTFATEPYECGWASEAIFFVRKMDAAADLAGQQLKVQISLDGMRWCDAGAAVSLSAAEVDFVRVTHFGNWLRLAGALPEDSETRVLVVLSLKE